MIYYCAIKQQNIFYGKSMQNYDVYTFLNNGFYLNKEILQKSYNIKHSYQAISKTTKLKELKE